MRPLHPTDLVTAEAAITVDLVLPNDQMYEPACGLASAVYLEVLTFETLARPPRLIVLHLNGEIIASCGIELASEVADNVLKVETFAAGHEAELRASCREHGATQPHQWAEISAFNVVSEHRRPEVVQALLSEAFAYLRDLNVPASTHILSAALRPPLRALGAKIKNICKASAENYSGTAAQRQTITDKYLTPCRAKCVHIATNTVGRAAATLITGPSLAVHHSETRLRA